MLKQNVLDRSYWNVYDVILRDHQKLATTLVKIGDN